MSGEHRASWIARALSIAALLALITVPVPTRAADLLTAAWSPWTRAGVPETEFRLGDDGVLTVVADRSWGVRYRRLEPADHPAGVLTWAWRVDALAVPAPALDATHDSRPLALHVGFDEAPAREGFWGGLRRAVGTLLGLPAWAKVLTYSWGGEGPLDTLIVNPYFPANGHVRILRPDAEPRGVWRTERIDIRRDFERAFGYPAPPVAYLALSADMDATQGRSRAAIRDLRFTAE